MLKTFIITDKLLEEYKKQEACHINDTPLILFKIIAFYSRAGLITQMSVLLSQRVEGSVAATAVVIFPTDSLCY